MEKEKIQIYIRQDIVSNLDEIFNRLRSIGIQPGQYLGKGHFAVVYAFENDKVLKITTDEDAAIVSSKVKNLQHVAKTYRVFKLKSISGAYFIIQEKLKPADNTMIEVSNILCNERRIHTEDIPELERVFQRYKQSKLNYLLKDEKIAKLFKIISDPLSKGLFLHLVRFQPERVVFRLFDPKNIQAIAKHLEALKELYDHNIVFEDNQGDNIMRKGKVYKWSDLGFKSSAPGPDNVEIINAIKQKRTQGDFFFKKVSRV